MTTAQALGAIGLILTILAAVALAVIVFARLADRLEAWWSVRRAGAPGPGTASAQEARAASELGYHVSANGRRPA